MADMVAIEQTETAAVTLKMQVAFCVFMGFALLAALLYMHSLLRRLAKDRVNLFTVFLIVPRAVLMRLASAPVRLAIEDDEARLVGFARP